MAKILNGVMDIHRLGPTKFIVFLDDAKKEMGYILTVDDAKEIVRGLQQTIMEIEHG